MKSSRYLDRLVDMRCFPDLIRLKVFPNVKEMTESMAILSAVNNLGLKRNDDGVLFISVGDGVMPRTAALFAYATKWICIGIDPLIRFYDKKMHRLMKDTDRLYPIPYDVCHAEIKEILSGVTGPFHSVVFAFVHSHAKLFNSMEALKFLPIENRHIISMPCCYQDDLPIEPTKSYVDNRVISPKNRVNIYKDIDQALEEKVERSSALMSEAYFE